MPLRAADRKSFGVLGIYEDITERKLNEDALRRANRALKTLSAGNLALVRAASEDELLRMVKQLRCRPHIPSHITSLDAKG